MPVVKFCWPSWYLKARIYGLKIRTSVFVGKNLANFETVRGYVIRIAKGVTYEALMQEKMQVIDRNLEAELLCESRGRAP